MRFTIFANRYQTWCASIYLVTDPSSFPTAAIPPLHLNLQTDGPINRPVGPSNFRCLFSGRQFAPDQSYNQRMDLHQPPPPPRTPSPSTQTPCPKSDNRPEICDPLLASDLMGVLVDGLLGCCVGRLIDRKIGRLPDRRAGRFGASEII